MRTTHHDPARAAGWTISPAPILSTRGETKTYRTGAQEVHALQGIDIDVHPGELVMVMGPSGNGKTTLLNCLSGLDDIDAGTVTVDGVDLFTMSDADRTRHRAQRMGFIFQAFNLIPVFTATENVELPLLLAGVKPATARAAARETLARVGLSHRLDHRPTELSGGEQQRVTVARALTGRPRIVWADEPTGNLDSETGARVLALLAELNHELRITLVLATHAQEVAAAAGRVLRMRDGRLADSAATRALSRAAASV